METTVVDAVSAAASDFRAILIGQAVGAAWTVSIYLRSYPNASSA